MSNMSYCRFENTYHDLMDCVENWEEYEGDDLSVSEKKYRQRILELAKDIVNDYGQDEEDEEN